MATQSVGQVAYEAFGEHQAWIFRGVLMPSWSSVTVDEQDAWQAAGKAVIRHLQLAKNAAAMQALDAGEEPHG